MGKQYRCQWCKKLFGYPGIMRHGKFCKKRKAIETERQVMNDLLAMRPRGLDLFIDNESQSMINDDMEEK